MSIVTKRPVILTLALSAMLLSNTSLRATETDERIEESAKKSYVFRTYLLEDSIKTEAKDGIVTLTGVVSEESHKLLATDTVSGLPGVTRVDNQITIKDAPAEHSDTWLFMKVKSTLAYHRSVSAFHTEVAVSEGVVTLKGEASNMAQKELATEYAKDVEGVKDVRNEMTVAATPAEPAKTIAEIIDDASITAQVRTALWAHRSTNAFNTAISTTDGVVTVSGIAANVAEKDLVTKLVTDIIGVKSVVNNMTIQAAVTAK